MKEMKKTNNQAALKLKLAETERKASRKPAAIQLSLILLVDKIKREFDLAGWLRLIAALV